MTWSAALLALSLVARPAAAEPPLQPELLQDTLARFNKHAETALPTLTPSQLQELADGEVVKLLDRPGGGDTRRAVGLLVSPAAQRDLWVAAQDPHYTAAEGLTELRLTRDEVTGRATWYGHVDLPSPFKDRHWLVQVWNNHALHAASDGAFWEHPWRLLPGGVSKARGPVARGRVGALTLADWRGSIETPINQGAWIAIDLPGDRALLGYHATTVVGGNIPDGLFTRFVLAGMDKMLRGVERRARQEVPAHYVSGHEPMPAGGPGMTPFYDAP